MAQFLCLVRLTQPAGEAFFWFLRSSVETHTGLCFATPVWRTVSQLESSIVSRHPFARRSVSGSRVTLPPPGPLRTVRASFPAHGSSLGKAP